MSLSRLHNTQALPLRSEGAGLLAGNLLGGRRLDGSEAQEKLCLLGKLRVVLIEPSSCEIPSCHPPFCEIPFGAIVAPKLMCN